MIGSERVWRILYNARTVLGVRVHDTKFADGGDGAGQLESGREGGREGGRMQVQLDVAWRPISKMAVVRARLDSRRALRCLACQQHVR